MSKSPPPLITIVLSFTLAAIALVHPNALSPLRAGQPGHADQVQPNRGGLEVGFADCDITPAVGKDKRPVFLAGFGKNRRAAGILDPLLARAVVLRDGNKKIALVTVDLIGLFRQEVDKVRAKLPGFAYVGVSSTHNHEGPDTLGLWGPNFFQSGIDPVYQQKVVDGIVQAIFDADKSCKQVQARIGSVHAPELLHDGRLPLLKHDELIVLDFREVAGAKRVGVLVQWNCHPETLDDKNQLVSADFVAAAVKHLQGKLKCPVALFTGTVGGLMTSLHVEVKDAAGNSLKDGTVEKTVRYGQLVGRAAEQALGNAKDVTLTPFGVARRDVFLPIDNKLYMLAFRLGVLQRQGYLWEGDASQAKELPKNIIPAGKRGCIKTELSWLRLGQLDVACIPGEIYPELVLGKVQDPVDKGADFPEAKIEPAIYDQLKGPYRMILGLACDEIGYIIPKRQWDAVAPFCYGRKQSQYGEVNSLGPETAPLLCESFRDLVQKHGSE